MRNKRAKQIKRSVLVLSFGVDKDKEWTHKQIKDMCSDKKFKAMYRRRKKNELLARRFQSPKFNTSKRSARKAVVIERMAKALESLGKKTKTTTI